MVIGFSLILTVGLVAAAISLLLYLIAPWREYIWDTHKGDLKRDVLWSTDGDSLDLDALTRDTHYVSATDHIDHIDHIDQTQRHKRPYLSIVIPAYNETKRLPTCLNATIELLKQREACTSGKPSCVFSYEVIVVDDGSTDHTGLMVVRMRDTGQWDRDGSKVRVICLKQNRGKGFSVRMGMMAARGDYVLMMDADGATRLSDMMRLEKALLAGSGLSHTAGAEDERERSRPIVGSILPRELPESKVQVAFGSRKNLETEAIAKRQWWRNLLMYGFHLLVRILVGTDIKDTQCGFKLFSRRSAARIFPSLHLTKWAFDVEIVTIAQRLGIRIVEVPVTWHEIPGSKLNAFTAALQMARDMAVIRALYSLGIWKAD